MTLLTGLTEAGVEVPVQVKPDGRLVAEGLTGPAGPAGSVGPAGPAGPYAWRNILINGDLRINQRGVPIAAAAVGEYGPDRWKKASAGTMTQVIEDVNYIPNTVHTLSGAGVTTQQLTSPSSGHWTLPAVPITSTNIQLEPGSVATPFERRSYGQELSLCQRYYEKSYLDGVAPGSVTPVGQIVHTTVGDGAGFHFSNVNFIVPKRAEPTIVIYNPNTGTATNVHVFIGSYTGGAASNISQTTTTRTAIGSYAYSIGTVSARILHYTASAEL
jgi:hypothetical protein